MRIVVSDALSQDSAHIESVILQWWEARNSLVGLMLEPTAQDGITATERELPHIACQCPLAG